MRNAFLILIFPLGAILPLPQSKYIQSKPSIYLIRGRYINMRLIAKPNINTIEIVDFGLEKKANPQEHYDTSMF